MEAATDASRLRLWSFTAEIKPVLLPVFRPVSVECIRLLFGSNPESNQSQYHGANTYVRLGAASRCSTDGTFEDWGMDVSLGPNIVKHSI